MSKERPILFSAEMVKAILAGHKTQTRRVVKFNHKPWLEPLPHVEYARDGMPVWWDHPPCNSVRSSDYYDEGYPCPHGKPGDRLWVRESCRIGRCPNDPFGQVAYDDRTYKLHPSSPPGSDMWCREWKSVPSIFMPRWASRITLEVVGVRVERLHDISEADKLAEGATPDMPFGTVWRKINTKPGIRWEDNPWVWVVEFKNLSKEGR